jgi:hypothetical protein
MHACRLARNATAAMLIEKGANIDASDEVSNSTKVRWDEIK